MCLAIPGKVVGLEGTQGTVDFEGIQRKVDCSLLDSIEAGEYVLVHVGFAIQKVDEKTARETYRLLAEVDKEELEEELNAPQ